MLTTKKNPFQIDRKLTVPFRGGKTQQRTGGSHARVIDQHIEGAELLHRPRHGLFNVRLNRHISRKGHDPALATQLLRHLRGAVCVDIKHHYGGPCCHEALGNAGANSHSRTCHEGDSVLQTHAVDSLPGAWRPNYGVLFSREYHHKAARSAPCPQGTIPP